MPKRKAPSTAWKPGQSGNPDGKALTAALRKRAHDPAKDEQGNEILEADPKSGKRSIVKRLDLVADALLRKAMKGDINAVVEVFNRLDGKVLNENHNTNEVGDNTLQALLKAIDGRSRDIVAPALTEDMPEEEETWH